MLSSQFLVFDSAERLDNILPVLACEKVGDVSGTLGLLCGLSCRRQ